MARVTKTDLIDKMVGVEYANRYMFEHVINAFLRNILMEIQAGNVVAIRGLGTFYIDTKKKRDGLETYETSPQLYNTTRIWVPHGENLKPFRNLPPDPYKTEGFYNHYQYARYDIYNYKKYAIKVSKELQNSVGVGNTVRVRKPPLKRMRRVTSQNSFVYTPAYIYLV